MINTILKISARIHGFLYWWIKYMTISRNAQFHTSLVPLLSQIRGVNFQNTVPQIEKIRAQLIRSKSIQDNDQSQISQHAKSSTSPPLNAAILRLICKYTKAKNVLELGTSVGISSAYMSYDINLHVDTIDINESMTKIAVEVHQKLGIKNVNFHIGSFDQCLSKILNNRIKFDVIFVDGDHSYDGTINNFVKLLPYCSKNAVIIIDDINWSWEMHKAWNKIIANHNVRWSINLYHMGIVGFSDEIIVNANLYEVPYLYWSWFTRTLKTN